MCIKVYYMFSYGFMHGHCSMTFEDLEFFFLYENLLAKKECNCSKNMEYANYHVIDLTGYRIRIQRGRIWNLRVQKFLAIKNLLYFLLSLRCFWTYLLINPSNVFQVQKREVQQLLFVFFSVSKRIIISWYCGKPTELWTIFKF